MADTPRTRTALQTILADNTTRAITAQNIRDFLASTPLTTQITEYPPILHITKTGDWCLPVFFEVSSTVYNMDTDGTITQFRGKAVDSFAYIEPTPNATIPNYFRNILSMSLDDLAIIHGTLGITLPLATSLEFPELIDVRGTATISGNNLTSITFPKLIYSGGTMTLSTVANLASLSFPELIFINGITITAPICTSVSFPKLKRSLASISITTNSATSLNLSALEMSGSIVITANNIAEIDLDNVEYINGNISLSGSSVTSLKIGKLAHVVGSISTSNLSNVDFNNLSFPELIDTTSFISISTTRLSTCSFPKLKSTGSFSASASSGVSLTTLSLPELEYMTTSTTSAISGWSTLTTITIPKLISAAGTISANSIANLSDITQLGAIGVTKALESLAFTSCGLSQTSVDYIFDLLLSLDGTNGTTLWTGITKSLNISGGTTPSIPFLGTTISGINGSAFYGSGFSSIGVMANVTAHGFSTNDIVTITGIQTKTNFNGTFVITRQTNDTFSYTTTGTAGTGTGTGTVTLKRNAAASTDNYTKMQRLIARSTTPPNITVNL